jgi:hypothetical protein
VLKNRLSAHKIEGCRSGAVIPPATQLSDIASLSSGCRIFRRPSPAPGGAKVIAPPNPKDRRRTTPAIRQCRKPSLRRLESPVTETKRSAALQDVASKLEHRRDRIARTRRSLGVVMDAYSLVAADLRAATAAHDDRSCSTSEEAPK